MQIIDSQTAFAENADGLAIVRSQEIPDGFMSWLSARRAESKAQREGAFMHVARIPVIFQEKYLREGFDITREPIKETVKRLHRDGLEGFMATEKRI